MIAIKNPGYFWLDTWVLANVIQLATQDFCLRFLNRTNDPYTRKVLSDHVDNEDREDGVTIRDAIGRWVLYLRRTLRRMARPWALMDCWRTMPLLLADLGRPERS